MHETKMKIFIKYILFFFLIPFILQAQNTVVTISGSNGNNDVAAYINKGLVFVSATELSTALGGNYYINDDAAKVEMKFPDNKIKFTGRNQFIVIIPRDGGNKEVIQLPVSTLISGKDVYIPLEYCIKYIGKAYGKELKFDTMRRSINIGEIPAIAANPIKRRPPVNSNYDVSGLSVSQKANGTLITLRAKKNVGRMNFSIKETTGILFLYGVTVDPELTSGVASEGIIKKVRQKKVGANTQIEFTLGGEYTNYDAFQDNATNDIFITIQSKIIGDTTSATQLYDLDKWKFDVIVLDAGHGGKDAGAIGVTGVYEKDINLAITKELGKLINEGLDSVKVVYTRDTDEFIELHERGKIANRNKGKLFISIHCNSLGNKNRSARGFEVYLLRPGRTDEAIAIAEFENSVIKYEENPDIYQTLNDENFILVSMAHSSYMRYSENFSDLLNRHWQSSVGIPSRGVKQAGFYVLVGASMPGVLVETGFISNKEDEKYLKSKKGQQQIARTIFNAIKDYKNYYENSFADGTPVDLN